MTSLLDIFIYTFYEGIKQAQEKREEEAKTKYNFPDAVDVEYRVIDDGK